MNLSASLYITPKGEDEVKRRVYKLDMKKRSLLILLDRPQTIEYLGGKTVLPREEFNAVIISLIQDGFIATGNVAVGAAAPSAAGASGSAQPAGNVRIHIDDEVILSEAKFLLTDFCVDSFGTSSQAYVDAIRACKSINDLRYQLNTILAAAEKQVPAQLPTLIKVIQEINATA